MLNTTEKQFETDIETSLITQGGYVKGDPKAFDRELALDKDTFIQFIQASQPKKWERLEKIYKADTGKKLIERFDKEVHQRGLLQGLSCVPEKLLPL